MTGDLVGTLRYMSPEQALAKHGLVDHRTDVYSLGVTLYELLTGTPAVDGMDREEILNRITREEPRQPRTVDRAIPRDLETIVIKAVAKTPSERYASAAELADDLRRFLEDKPIRAKRPSLVQRAAKWSRGHRSVVWAGILLLVVVAIGSGIATLLIARERDVAKGERDVAKAKSEEAYRNLGVAYMILDILGNKLAEKGSLDEAIAARKEFLQIYPDVGVAHNSLGTALQKKGAWDEAIAAFKEAIRLDPSQAAGHNNLGTSLQNKNAWDEAIDAHKEAIRLKPDFAEAYNDLGVALMGKGALDEAIAACKKAIYLQPDNAGMYSNLGVALHRKGSLDEAIAAHEKAIGLKPNEAEFHGELALDLCQKGALDQALTAIRNAIRLDPGDASFHKNLGVILEMKGDWDEAIAACKKAIRLKPDNVVAAIAHETLGSALQGKGALDEAVAAHKEAIRLQPKSGRYHHSLGLAYLRNDALDEAVAAYKEALRLQPDYPGALSNLGETLIEKGAWDEADTVLKHAMAIYQKLAKDRPEEAYTRLGWAATLIRSGELHRNTGRSQEAEKELRQAQASLEKLLSESPKDHWCLRRMADVLIAQAKLCRDRDELAEARRLFGEALGRQKIALELSETTPFYQGLVAIHSLELADTLLQLFVPAEAKDQVEQLLREAVRYSANDRAGQNALAWFLATCREERFRDPKRAVELAKRLVELAPQKGLYWRTLGAAHYGLEDWKGTVAAMEKAMKVRNGGDGTERFFIAMARWHMGNPEAARADYEAAVQWMNKHRPQYHDLRRYQTEAAALLGIQEQPPNKQSGKRKQHSEAQPKDRTDS
jgi:tetratricopeptide (TPR) repeat protein